MIVPDTLEAILFDLDGTLVDTDDAAVDRLARLLRGLSFIFPRRNSARFARWLIMHAESPGNAFLTLLDILGLDQALTALTNRLQRPFRRPPTDFRLISGTTDTLEHLSRRYKLALVTTRSRRHIDQFRSRHPAVARHLLEFIGRQDTIRFKPHPAPLHLAARRLNVPIARCLMVGDTAVDVQAARRAGARSVAVLSGFGFEEELVRAGADVVLGSITELREILRC
jgi:phosphoglycolate phosphatase